MTASTSYYAPALLAGLFLACGAAQVVGQLPGSNGIANVDMTLTKPESVGFSSERLERLHALMQQVVDQKQLPGAVTLLARHGKVVYYRTYGIRKAASRPPVTRATIISGVSMTKPMTTVAMMLLHMTRKLLPLHPITKQ